MHQNTDFCNEQMLVMEIKSSFTHQTYPILGQPSRRNIRGKTQFHFKVRKSLLYENVRG